MDKADVFLKELVYIENDDIRNETTNLIRHLPDYFFEVAASSTGKYHPEYTLGKGGLVKHTQAAVKIAYDLLRLDMFKGLSEDKDFIIAALILHDGWKHGVEYQQFAKAQHPIIAAERVKDYSENKDIGARIANLIITHMGQWNTDWKTNEEILPKPENKAQFFVHLCDYLASRKYLEVNFEV
jgi:hypothetical protein